MPMDICFYEDNKFSQFYPITYLRPVYTMRAGIVPLFKRAERVFGESSISFTGRSQVVSLVSERFSDYPVNIINRTGDNVLFLNGRIRDYGDLVQQINTTRLSTCFKSKNGETVGVLFMLGANSDIPKLATPADYYARFEAERADIPDFDTTATLYDYHWDIMADIKAEIETDFRHLRESFPVAPKVKMHEGAHLVNPADIQLDNDVEVCPTAVIDASHGPVYIGQNTRIEAHAAVYGPCYIGPNSVVLAGKVEQCSIGHTCRVGGEVEESVFESYVNKYHAGFIGHSYVGSWVNFGAMTTNSDLKNNYSNIRVSMNGEMIDSGSIKIGSFIGDHTKFGIGTLLNTGINIGVCCNIFGGSLIADKEIPSFQWGNTGNYETYMLDKALNTAKRTAERRNARFTEREEAALTAVFNKDLSSDGVLDF